MIILKESFKKCKPLAQIRLGLFDGLCVVSQILELAIEAAQQQILMPVHLEAYTLSQTMRVLLAEDAIRLHTGIRDDHVYQITPARQRNQLAVLGAEGLRLVRSIKLLGPEYEIGPDEMVIIDTLIMMKCGLFATAEIAQERIVEVLSIYM